MPTNFFKFFLISYISFQINTISLAQSPFKAGIFSGITTSQIDGDGYSGFDKLGFGIGGFVNNNFNSKNFSWQMELLYIHKGSRRPPDPEKGVTLYQINLNYVEIPVLAKLQFKKLVYEAGLSYGQLIRHREFDISGELLHTSAFKKKELAFNAGLNFFFNEKISFNARFIRSILPVRDYAVLTRFGFFGFVGGSYNTALLYTLRFHFGIKKKESGNEEKKLDINKILKIE